MEKFFATLFRSNNRKNKEKIFIINILIKS